MPEASSRRRHDDVASASAARSAVKPASCWRFASQALSRSGQSDRGSARPAPRWSQSTMSRWGSLQCSATSVIDPPGPPVSTTSASGRRSSVVAGITTTGRVRVSAAGSLQSVGTSTRVHRADGGVPTGHGHGHSSAVWAAVERGCVPRSWRRGCTPRRRRVWRTRRRPSPVPVRAGGASSGLGSAAGGVAGIGSRSTRATERGAAGRTMRRPARSSRTGTGSTR